MYRTKIDKITTILIIFNIIETKRLNAKFPFLTGQFIKFLRVKFE